MDKDTAFEKVGKPKKTTSIEVLYNVETNNKYGLLEMEKVNKATNKQKESFTKENKTRIPPIILKRATEHSTLSRAIQKIISSQNLLVKHISKSTQVILKNDRDLELVKRDLVKDGVDFSPTQVGTKKRKRWF